MRSILEAAAPRRVVRTRPDQSQFFKDPLVSSGIYTPIYATRQAFLAVAPAEMDHRTFFVLRDPRDALVSWYFSMRYSHSTENSEVVQMRDTLSRLSKADGLAELIERHMPHVIAIQRSWLGTGTEIFRFEDLLADQQGSFNRMLAFCGIDPGEKIRRRIVRRNSFKRLTWWRLGREDITSHHRRGKAGDWKNHFDEGVKKLFKDRHGGDLVAAGYERDGEW